MPNRICWECGQSIDGKQFYLHRHYDIRCSRPIDNERRYCKSCYNNRLEEKRRMDAAYKEIKQKRLTETAITKIVSQGIDPYKYREEIQTVMESYYSGKSKFDSSLEFMVATQLIREKVRVKTQVDIKGYRVDLMLPDMSIIVEVDGRGHSKSKESDAMRDVLIHELLGPEWEIIRINTNRIERELSDIFSWIKTQYDKQQILREKNDGMIPWTHSRNEYSEIIRLGRKLKPIKEITSLDPI